MHADSLETRCCTKCGERKPLDEFRTGANRTGKLYRHRSCNACQAKSASEWQTENRPHVNDLQMRRYHESKKFDKKFMERKREINRLYMAARRARDPEVRRRAREAIRDKRLQFTAKFLIRSAKSRAAKKGIEFDLTLEWANDRWTGKCELSGIEFRQSTGRQNPYSPSIDRIDGSKGYIQGNCRFILSAINYLKANGTDEQMFHIASELIARRAPSPI